MSFRAPLDRGFVDSMTAERPTFSFKTLTQSDKSWSCHVVDGQGRVAVDEDGRLASYRPHPDVPAWLLGETSDGVIHCCVTAQMLSETRSARTSTTNDHDSEPENNRVDDFTFARLTEIATTLSDDEALLATQAVSLGRWHADNRYCARCAAPVAATEAGWASLCTGCGVVEYPRTDPAVIVRVLDGRDRILLGHNTAWPEKRMSLLAGYVDAGETPERTVIRELREEVDLKVTGPRYIGAQPWPGPRSLMLGFEARVEGTPLPTPDSLEIDRAQFFSRAELRAAIATGEVLPPGPASIAHALIHDWLKQPGPDEGDPKADPRGEQSPKANLRDEQSPEANLRDEQAPDEGVPPAPPEPSPRRATDDFDPTNLDGLLDRLATSKFRASFQLSRDDRDLVTVRGMETIREHARNLIGKRLAPANPKKDGKQTPYRGHPVFPAQHATGTCCRSCLLKWHGLPKGQELTECEQDYVVEVICRWIDRQRALPLPPESQRGRHGPNKKRRQRDQGQSTPAQEPLF